MRNLVNKIDESEKKLISEDNHFMVLRLKVFSSVKIEVPQIEAEAE